MKENKKSQNDSSKIKQNDFIELEFTGRIKDSEIFDTNIKQEATKINLNIETRPFIICIGQKMILPAIDDFLIGKPLGNYNLELTPEKAFGDRKKELIQTMPLSVFSKQQVNPQPGMMFNFDNMIGRISAVSGGRVIVDFNNPLSGKIVVYELNTKRKLTDLNEKIKTLIKFFFRMPLNYESEGKKLIIWADKPLENFINLFKPKFKEILGLDLEFKEKKKEKEIEQSKKTDEKPKQTEKPEKETIEPSKKNQEDKILKNKESENEIQKNNLNAGKKQLAKKNITDEK